MNRETFPSSPSTRTEAHKSLLPTGQNAVSPAPAWRTDPLPIDAVLEALGRALQDRAEAVVVAPPGAGKTTRVPLMLAEAAWAVGKRLIVLEPRRLAARAAAERMAAMRNEPVGATVGLRARFDTRVSGETRIEIVTEGVFTRMILDDPGLAGVAGVIFDEFHERSLDADLGLALALETQAVLRDDLRLLVMSATLDGARVSSVLNGAPVIESEGRAYPVETRYRGRDPALRIEEDVAALIIAAHGQETGSILVFLPGQGEITRVISHLEGRLGQATDLAPLFGAMDRAAQDRAIAPAAPGRRKVVLATSIAETSLTIEGVRVVVDSGLARVPRFEPDMGLTRLETVRVSRASADQRRGRAGRTEPGVCYRLWEEAGNGALQRFSRPEILDADLSGLLLDLGVWGTRDPTELRWLDPPPAPALAAARRVLETVGALNESGGMTAEGRRIAALALPPRLARAVLSAARLGAADLGGDVATLLVERGLGGSGPDLGERLDRWRRDRSSRADAARGLSRGFARAARQAVGSELRNGDTSLRPGHVLALAFPERIAKARGRPGEYLLANGRAASLEAHDRLAAEPFLAVGELAGRAGSSRILLAAAISPAEIEAVSGEQIVESDDLAFDATRARLVARKTTRLGALTLADAQQPVPASEDAARLLAGGIARIGIDRLPWTAALTHWRARVAFLRAAEADPWPDLSDDRLRQTAEEWLAPFLMGRTALDAVTADDLGQALGALVPFELGRRLDREAPSHFEAPTGSRLAVDYADQAGPSIAVRVQELFGLTEHPALAGGRVPLTLHLLSPAQRPIQVTRDLPGFWKGSWAVVKSEMKGRYPRHPWPDDPAAAPATNRAKPRGQ